MEEKKGEEMEGEVKGEMVPHFWYKVTPMSSSDIHMRRIGLATSNQSALFMMSINRYYVKYNIDLLYWLTVQQVSNLQVCNCKTLKTLAMTLHLWMMLHLTVIT